MLLIAIDSAKQMRYTGVLSGTKEEADSVYLKLEKLFGEYHINPPFHWCKITRKVKEGCRDRIDKILEDSKLNINVFHHPKPMNITRKDYFIIHVPNNISEMVEKWLRFKRGSVDIIVDDDYNFGTGRTDNFMENLLKQTTYRLAGIPVKLRKENKLKATIKFPNGYILDFYASISDLRNSKELQLVDIFLGYCIENKSKNFNKREFFRKI